MRTWKIVDMPPVEAGLISAAGQMFILQRPDGGLIIMPLNKLSKADRDYVRKVLADKK
jgi:hypothetical protein